MSHVASRRAAWQWLRQFECQRGQRDAPYTHSSLRGTWDWTTCSGKLNIPDTEDVQRQLFEAISFLSSCRSPLCYVEMCTPRRPIIVDIDVLGSTDEQAGCAPDELILNSDFFKLRAQELHRACPGIAPLELALFTASGWHRDKSCWKASFHAVWRQLVVTQDMASSIRSATVEAFEQLSEEEPLKSLRGQLLELPPKNTWDMVFDITSVRGGSFRMPFCDKVAEGREVRPVGVFVFEFGEPHADDVKQVLRHGPDGLTSVEWLARGTVRLPQEPSPPLAEVAPSISQRPGRLADEQRQPAHSSVPSLAQEVIGTLEC